VVVVAEDADREGGQQDEQDDDGRAEDATPPAAEETLVRLDVAHRARLRAAARGGLWRSLRRVTCGHPRQS
jgi:hypothetical protein